MTITQVIDRLVHNYNCELVSLIVGTWLFMLITFFHKLSFALNCIWTFSFIIVLYFNINCHFLVWGKAVKNVPVFFVMMASHTTANYKAVFKQREDLVGGVDEWDIRTIIGPSWPILSQIFGKHCASWEHIIIKPTMSKKYSFSLIIMYKILKLLKE